MSRAEPINAILYAQFHLKGGLRNTIVGVGLATLVVGGGCVLFLASNDIDPSAVTSAARGAATMILAVQWLLLGIYGTTRVSAAVRTDLSGGIIESHRLTPTAPLSAAIGYVVGGAVQALALSVPLLVIGGAMCLIGKISLSFWLTANGLALSSAVVVWTLVALLGFITTNAAAMPVLGIVSFASAQAAALLPASAVLGAPLFGQSVFGTMMGSHSLPPAFGFTIAAHLLFTGLLLLAVARRYRNADSPAFGVTLGLLLLGLWTAVTVIGIAQADLFTQRQAFYPVTADVDRLIAGLASTIVIAAIPLLPIARQMVRRVVAPHGRAVPAIVLLAVCVAIAVSPAFVPLDTPLNHLALRRLGTTAVAGALSTQLLLIFAWQLLGGRLKLLWPLAMLIVLLIIPPAVQASFEANDPNNNQAYEWIGSFSPLGALILLWHRHWDLAALRPGLIFQAALTVIPAALYIVRARKARDARHPPRGFAVQLPAATAAPHS